MKHRRLYLALMGGAFLVLVIVAVAAFLATHEKVEVDVPAPPDPQIEQDPYFTLESYIRELDIAIERQPDDLDSATLESQDLVILKLNAPSDRQWVDEVLGAWVDGGGHAIIIEPRGHEINDQWRWGDQEFVDVESIDPLSPEWVNISESVDAVSNLDFFDFDLDDEPVVVPETLDYLGFSPSNDDIFAASQARGAGRVTVVTDEYVLTNQGIKSTGVAETVVDWIRLGRSWPESALFVTESRRWTWIDEALARGWPFFVAVLLLLVFGLSRARRFGPPIPERERRRRRRGDHVRAVGHFLWKHNAGEVLVEASRRALIDAMSRRRPSLKTMSQGQRLEVMAEYFEMPQQKLRSLLYGPIPRSSGDYTSLIHELETLRRQL